MAKNSVCEMKDWRVEADARALIEAEAIKSDKKRLAAAKKEASRIANDMSQEVKAAKKVAKVSKKKKK